MIYCQMIKIQNPYPEIHIKKFDDPDLSFFSIPIEELARQICIFESELHLQFQFAEFQNVAWTRGNAATTSPNIVRAISRYNKV